MLNKLQRAFQFEETALHLRARRQEILSANIANDNTPGYKARDMDFASSLTAKLDSFGQNSSSEGASTLSTTRAEHINSGMEESGDMDSGLQYRVPFQSSVDGNTVEMEAEKGRATENAMHYLSVTNTLQQRFLWWSRFLQDKT